MSNANLRTITNSFQDVRLISLASWRAAADFPDRDHGGPYIVAQEGYDPEDPKVTPDEFVLGRSGKWLSLSFFYKMSIPDRRAEFLYGTAAEIMKVMSDLPPKAVVIRPGDTAPEAEIPGGDEMAAAIQMGKSDSKPPTT